MTWEWWKGLEETMLGKWTWGSQEVQATRVNFSSPDSGRSQRGGEEGARPEGRGPRGSSGWWAIIKDRQGRHDLRLPIRSLLSGPTSPENTEKTS